MYYTCTFRARISAVERVQVLYRYYNFTVERVYVSNIYYTCSVERVYVLYTYYTCTVGSIYVLCAQLWGAERERDGSFFFDWKRYTKVEG